MGREALPRFNRHPVSVESSDISESSAIVVSRANAADLPFGGGLHKLFTLW